MMRLCFFVLPLIGFVSASTDDDNLQMRERRASIMAFVCNRKSDLSFCKPHAQKLPKKPLYIPPDIPNTTRSPVGQASTFKPRGGRVQTTGDWADEKSWNVPPQLPHHNQKTKPHVAPRPDIGLGNPSWNSNPGFDRSVHNSGNRNGAGGLGIGSGVNAGPVGVGGGLGLNAPGLGGGGGGVPGLGGGGLGGVGVGSSLGVGPVGVSSGFGVGAPGIGGLGGGGGRGGGLFGISHGVGVSAPFVGPIGFSSGLGIGR